ncbi:SRPBCC family protein [Phytoactinopolyspora limicola]|uniref:SRPBCC family protein n=1 Tax=Phytoactinopolyspora limicola TaxID=2715536 RepID=UPI0014088770|nr:SRPBCC family protein [Phytoactinopolyspora limicola]
MEIAKNFQVDAPPADVWPALTDLSRVARCLPGADLRDIDADGVHHGTVSVKLGPAALSFQGRAHFDQVNRADGRLRVTASGSERQGRGTVRTTIAVQMTAAGAGTQVDVEADLELSGPVAQFGRRGGILEDVSDLLIEQFVGELKQEILHGSPSVTGDLGSPADPGDTTTQPELAAAAASTAPAPTPQARPTTLDQATGLWAYIPTPTPSTTSPAAGDPGLASPPAPPWPPPAAATASPTPSPPTQRTGSARASAPAPTLSAFRLARALARRRIRRLGERITNGLRRVTRRHRKAGS